MEQIWYCGRTCHLIWWRNTIGLTFVYCLKTLEKGKRASAYVSSLTLAAFLEALQTSYRQQNHVLLWDLRWLDGPALVLADPALPVRNYTFARRSEHSSRRRIKAHNTQCMEQLKIPMSIFVYFRETPMTIEGTDLCFSRDDIVIFLGDCIHAGGAWNHDPANYR